MEELSQETQRRVRKIKSDEGLTYENIAEKILDAIWLNETSTLSYINNVLNNGYCVFPESLDVPRYKKICKLDKLAILFNGLGIGESDKLISEYREVFGEDFIYPPKD